MGCSLYSFLSLSGFLFSLVITNPSTIILAFQIPLIQHSTSLPSSELSRGSEGLPFPKVGICQGTLNSGIIVRPTVEKAGKLYS